MTITVGTRVTLLPRHRTTGTDSPFPALDGRIATVTRIFDKGETVDVRWEPATDDNGKSWSIDWFRAVESDDVKVEEAPARPLIHFSDEKAGRNRSLAREYAAEAISRVLKPTHNALLKQAADGESVDAYALNEAITAAMRSATTRNGQSSARRKQAEHFAHLGHIVQAVLENHADNLPAYESGERSRITQEVKTRLIDAQQEIDVLIDSVETARSERSTLTQAASDERRRLCGQIDSLKEEVDALDDQVANLIVEKTDAELQVEEVEATLNWLIDRLDADNEKGLAKALIDTFREGYVAGNGNA